MCGALSVPGPLSVWPLGVSHCRSAIKASEIRGSWLRAVSRATCVSKAFALGMWVAGREFKIAAACSLMPWVVSVWVSNAGAVCVSERLSKWAGVGLKDPISDREGCAVGARGCRAAALWAVASCEETAQSNDIAGLDCITPVSCVSGD